MFDREGRLGDQLGCKPFERAMVGQGQQESEFVSGKAGCETAMFFADAPHGLRHPAKDGIPGLVSM